MHCTVYLLGGGIEEALYSILEGDSRGTVQCTWGDRRGTVQCTGGIEGVTWLSYISSVCSLM